MCSEIVLLLNIYLMLRGEGFINDFFVTGLLWDNNSVPPRNIYVFKYKIQYKVSRSELRLDISYDCMFSIKK